MWFTDILAIYFSVIAWLQHRWQTKMCTPPTRTPTHKLVKTMSSIQVISPNIFVMLDNNGRSSSILCGAQHSSSYLRTIYVLNKYTFTGEKYKCDECKWCQVKCTRAHCHFPGMNLSVPRCVSHDKWKSILKPT